MAARRSAFQTASLAAIAWLLTQLPAAAATLTGTVLDAITTRPVSGAEVAVEHSGQVLGRGFSTADGRFSVTLEPPSQDLVTLTAIVTSTEHDRQSTSVQFDNGAALGTLEISLLPRWAAACRAGTDHSVIVGFFLPPPSGDELSDLPDRVARSMGFALTVRLQQAHLSNALQPSFEPCAEARPRTPQLGAAIAKALQADAFVGGDIAHDAASFKVSTYVSDAHGRLGPYVVAVNDSVDLASPSGATMADATHAAVLASVAAGLAENGDCVTAMTVLTIAERLVIDIPAYITALQDDCRAQLPNLGLLPGGAP